MGRVVDLFVMDLERGFGLTPSTRRFFSLAPSPLPRPSERGEGLPTRLVELVDPVQTGKLVCPPRLGTNAITLDFPAPLSPINTTRPARVDQ